MKPRHPEKINNQSHPIRKKPNWIRVKILNTPNFFRTEEIINRKIKDVLKRKNKWLIDKFNNVVADEYIADLLRDEDQTKLDVD